MVSSLTNPYHFLVVMMQSRTETWPEKPKPRLLFCSWHSYLDPSNGAALCTRDLWELLASRGWECKTFCGPALDFNGTIPQVVQDLGVSFVEKPWTEDGLAFSMFHYAQGGVPVSIFDLPGRPAKGSPTPVDGRVFLDLCNKVLDQFKPDVLLTYGGNWVVRGIMEAARRRKIRVAFALHNFAYEKAGDLFAKVDAVLVPSRFAQAHYQKVLGLETTPIPGRGTGQRSVAPILNAVSSLLLIPNRIRACLSSLESPLN